MLLNTKQYDFLKTTQRAELRSTIIINKASVTAAYLDQADVVLNMASQLTPEILNDETKFRDFFVNQSPIFDQMNDDFTNEMRVALGNAGILGWVHTGQYPLLAGNPLIDFGPPTDFVEKLIMPSDIDGFDLSKALWGDTNKKDLLKFIVNANNQGISPGGIAQVLEQYLKNVDTTGKGGYFYKVTRLIDTELQRAYSHESINSTREYNNLFPTEKLYWKREVSAAHTVPDICDALAGTYDTEGQVPSVPSHPFCICLISRIFADDYRGKVVFMNDKVYTDNISGISQKTI